MGIITSKIYKLYSKNDGNVKYNTGYFEPKYTICDNPSSPIHSIITIDDNTDSNEFTSLFIDVELSNSYDL